MPVFKSINLICLVMLYLVGPARYFWAYGTGCSDVAIRVMLSAMTSQCCTKFSDRHAHWLGEIDEHPGCGWLLRRGRRRQAQLSLLADPYRLAIDMPDASWQVDGLPQRGDLGIGLASAYRFGSPKPDTGRLVIELNQPAAPVRAFTLPPASGGERFVVDLVNVGDTAFMVAAAALKKSPGATFAAPLPI